MKRRIGLLICTAIILAAFSGCMVKKDAGITGETSKEITVEFTPEITKESTKEQPNANNSDSNTNQNSTQPNKNDNKTEPTPEFYDFMTLDPDVDIENEQVREDILTRIGPFIEHRTKNKNVNFTKKEIYLYELYYEDKFVPSSTISYYLKLGTTDFYSPNTTKKLFDLGFEFSPYDYPNYDYPFIRFQTKKPNCSKEEYVEKLKQVLKILLEDHNVTYASVNPNNIEEK